MLTEEKAMMLEYFLKNNNIILSEVQDYVHKQEQVTLDQKKIAEERCRNLLGKCFKIRRSNGSYIFYKVIYTEAPYESVTCLSIPPLNVGYYYGAPQLSELLDIHKIKAELFDKEDGRFKQISTAEFEEAGMEFMRKFLNMEV